METTLAGVGAIATAFAVLVAVVQLGLSRRQARNDFESRLVDTYREIAADLPVDALLGSPMDKDDLAVHLPAFYRYIDFSNEQCFLALTGAVRSDTWEQWETGIRTNFRRPAFQAAWAQIDERVGGEGGDFQELRDFLGGG